MPPRFTSPAPSNRHLMLATGFVFALSGCDIFLANGAGFEQDGWVDTDHGSFSVYRLTARELSGFEAGSGGFQREDQYFVLIGTNYIPCRGHYVACRAVVEAYFRDNPRPKPSRQLPVETNGDTNIQPNTSTGGDEPYVPPPTDPVEEDDSEDT